jgi:Zn-finger nucleic acid-binding protein
MKCTSILDKTEIEDVEVDACPKCGGLWLDEGEIEKISAKAANDVERLRGLLVSKGGAPAVPSEIQDACPACTAKMREVQVGEIHVDYCGSCKGIFLDRGELEKALDLVKGAGGTMLSLIATAIAEAPVESSDVEV